MAEEQLSKDVESISFMDVNPENPTTVVESMCMNCHENGTTTFLLTKIPHFREIIISSFECQHCNFKNNSVQFGGAIQPKGVRFTLKVVEKKVRW
jgi:zinc finger protein